MHHSAHNSMFPRVVDSTMSAPYIARMVMKYVAGQAYTQTVVNMHPSVRELTTGVMMSNDIPEQSGKTMTNMQADNVHMCGTPVAHVHKNIARIRTVPPTHVPQCEAQKQRLSIR